MKLACTIAFALGLAATVPASAQQSWPSKEIRLISPLAAGAGGSEVTARLVWGFSCQGVSAASFLPFFSVLGPILLFDPRREHSSVL